MDLSNLEIRECNYNHKNDLDALVELLNEYIKDEMGGGTPVSGLHKLRLVDGLNTHPTSIVLVAIIDNEYAGLLIGFETFATFSIKRCINIHDLIVRPGYREKGIGKALMNKVIDIATKRDCAKITLEVREDNYKAQLLYHNLGFAECDPPMKFWVKKM